MNTFAMSPKASASERETDKANIIRPEDVSTNRDLKNYFKQRLGPDFDELDSVLVDRDFFLRLLHSEHALLGKMISEDEKAAADIFLAYAGDKLNRVIMTFNIESPNVGNRAVKFIKEHKTLPEHDLWLAEMEQLSFKMQKLHHQWRRQRFLYYKIPNLKKSKKADASAKED
ncbi:MAG: hypothetical protein ACOY3I_02495 [Verrucomicrobiota bacterium]